MDYSVNPNKTPNYFFSASFMTLQYSYTSLIPLGSNVPEHAYLEADVLH